VSPLSLCPPFAPAQAFLVLGFGWLGSVLSTWLEFVQADLPFIRAYMIEFWAAG
jgi:hypothetical protein